MNSDLKKKIATMRINGFLGELRRTTLLSSRFLNIARPTVEHLFNNIPDNRQAELLEEFWQTACDHNPEMDSSFESLSDIVVAEEFSQKETVFLRALENMKRQMQFIHAEIACLQLITFGGFGGQVVAQG